MHILYLWFCLCYNISAATIIENVSGLIQADIKGWILTSHNKNLQWQKYMQIIHRLLSLLIFLDLFDIFSSKRLMHVWYWNPPEKSVLIDGHDISHSVFLPAFFMFSSVTLLNPTPSKTTYFFPTVALLALFIKSPLTYRTVAFVLYLRCRLRASNSNRLNAFKSRRRTDSLTVFLVSGSISANEMLIRLAIDNWLLAATGNRAVELL